MSNNVTKVLKSQSWAIKSNVFFQLVEGDFADNKYAVQFVKKLKTKDKLLDRDSYSTKEKAESVFSSYLIINDYNKKYEIIC
jgi:hypothetical protein